MTNKKRIPAQHSTGEYGYAIRPQSVVILTVSAEPCSAAASAFLLGCWHRRSYLQPDHQGRHQPVPRHGL